MDIVTHLKQIFLYYRNQSVDLFCKSITGLYMMRTLVANELNFKDSLDYQGLIFSGYMWQSRKV